MSVFGQFTNLGNPNGKTTIIVQDNKEKNVDSEINLGTDIDVDNVVVEEEAINTTNLSKDGKIIVGSKKASSINEKKVSTSFPLTQGASDLLSKVNKINKDLKANTTINMVLESCYDPATKSFNEDIPEKQLEKNVTYSVQIAKKYKDALLKEAKKRNMTVGEYLSELILRKVSFEE